MTIDDAPQSHDQSLSPFHFGQPLLCVNSRIPEQARILNKDHISNSHSASSFYTFTIRVYQSPSIVLF